LVNANENHSFGLAGGILEQLIAFFGIFFAYTNTVGAALWAYDIEKDASLDQVVQDLKDQVDQLVASLKAHLTSLDLPDADQVVQDVKDKADQLLATFKTQISGLQVSNPDQMVQNLKDQADQLVAKVKTQISTFEVSSPDQVI
jgi:ElaB/YqjD/DUF883 family membrane-anchored ribosome-binding protein